MSRARPAGPLIVRGERIFRPSQDGRGDYGDGLSVVEILELSLERYQEAHRGTLRVDGRSGPHTLCVEEGRSVVDSYRVTFDLLAWATRLRALVRRRLGPT